MKVCIVHNEYGVNAGEETAVRNIKQNLLDHGHQVTCFFRQTKDCLQKPFGKLRAFSSGIRNNQVGREFEEMLSVERPDLIQIQNIYPVISSIVFNIARKAEIPIVLRCSNYRLFCPTGLLMSKRTGEICEDCIRGGEFYCIWQNCEASICKSIGYALRTAYNRMSGSIIQNTSIFYCPSNFLKNKLIEWNIPEQQVSVIPNSVQDVTSVLKPASKGSYVGYIGRISPEKGINVLLEVARTIRDIPIRIAGPLSIAFKGLTKGIPDNVDLVGELSGDDLEEFYSGARIIVLPSICYEVFPNVALEAMVRARPVIASRIGGIPELIDEGITGYLAVPRDANDFATKIRNLWNDEQLCERMGIAGRCKAQRDYSQERFYRRLITVYRKALQNKQKFSIH